MEPLPVPPFKPDTYQVYVTCNNCDFIGDVSILKGSLTVDVLPSTKCPTCGCTTLTKTSRPKSDFLRNPLVSPVPKPRATPFFGEPIRKQSKFSDWKYDQFAPKFHTSISRQMTNDQFANRNYNGKRNIFL